MSFLHILCANEERKKTFIAVTCYGTETWRLCKDNDLEMITVKNNLASRFAFEMNCKKHFSPGQTCFTFWGPVMLGSKGYLVNVIGCAVSNLFYPEIDFWRYFPLLKRQQNKLKDIYRRKMIPQADYWVFETPVLAKRAVELCSFPKERIGVVRMTASKLVSPEKVKPELRNSLDSQLPKGFRILLLSSAHANKRQHLLPVIAKSLSRKSNESICFVTTMDMQSKYAKKVIRDFERMNVPDYLYNIGPVRYDEAATLIDCCDAVCCISALESFSNNFVEAWRMKRLLIATNSDWARDACGSGAVYVNPENAEETADAIIEQAVNVGMREKIVQFGQEQLDRYPTLEEKNQCYYSEIEKTSKLGSCPDSDRRKIHWPRMTRGKTQ